MSFIRYTYREKLNLGDRMFFKPRYDVFIAKKEDKQIIKSLLENGVQTGAYEEKIIQDRTKFNLMLESMISGQHLPDQYGRVVSTLSCKEKKSTIGFMTLAIDQNKKEVELWYFSLLESFRNQGKGKRFLEVLFKMLKRETPDYKIFARCKDSSVEISYLLTDNEFVKQGSNKEGFNFYYRYKI